MQSRHPNCTCVDWDGEYDVGNQCRVFRERDPSATWPCMHCHGFLLRALLERIDANSRRT